MALEGDEARQLATAIRSVEKHYPNLNPLSEKHMALMALVIVGGKIYGKRALIIMGKAPARKSAIAPLGDGGSRVVNGASPAEVPPEIQPWFSDAPKDHVN